jgi:hypothetical protein
MRTGPDRDGVYYEEYRDDLGRPHREDGPALRWWWVDRKGRERPIRDIWVNHGDYHRLGGPAIVEYDDRGRPWREEWYYAGHRHRDDGPAVVQYDEAGKPVIEEHYVRGHKV